MVERVIVIVNSASGTGCEPELPGGLVQELLRRCRGLSDVEVAVVTGHGAARQAARAFAGASPRPAAVIAAGGGGTLRAAVEGVYDSSAEDRILMGALRMGSGNVLARRLGVARDPHLGMRQLAAAMHAGRTVSAPVLRCRFGLGSGIDDVRHAVVMCGLGQWGRCSGDLARWHRAAPQGRAAGAALAGIERLNHVEYVAAAGLRLAQAAIFPAACELVEVTSGNTVERFRMLAGAVVTERVPGLPVRRGAVIVPRAGRPRWYRIAPDSPLTVRLLDREATEFFLDEDPEVAHGSIRLEVAGSLKFLCPEVV